MSIQAIAMPASHVASSVTTPAPSTRPAVTDNASGQHSVPSSVTASSVTSPVDQKQQVKAAVKAVKDFIQPMASNLEFQTDEESGRTVIKITDSSSGELIRQIPSEEMLEIAKALDRLQGLLVKQKA